MIGYSRLIAVPAAQPDDVARRSPAACPRSDSARPSWARHQPARQRDVRGPLAGHRVGQRAGLQVRQAQLGAPRRAASSSSVVGTTSRASMTLARAEQQRRADPAREREAAASAGQRVVHGGIDPLGDGECRRAGGCSATVAWLGIPASRRSSQICRTAASVSGVEEQLDGVDHQPTRLATHVGSNADALIDSNSAALSAPAPAGSTARTGASRRQRVAVARLGRLPARAATRRSPGRRTKHLCEASASSVSAVWFSVPRPGRDDDQHRRGRGRRARSRSVTPSAPISTSRPPAPSTSVSRPGRSTPRDRRASSPRVGSAMPARVPRPRPAPAARDSGEAVQFGHPGQPPDLGEVVVAVGAAGLHRFAHRDVDARPAARDRPAPRWPPSCRRRCRCR